MQETTTPTNDDIEAVIQMATQAAQNDPRTLPLRDTRTQLFVANLPYRVRWQDLKDLFRRAGTVLRADVSLGPDNRSRGYGTVLLATAEDAGRAVDMFSGYSWQGRILEVRADRVRDFDQPFPEPEEEYAPMGRNLFVGNLPFHVQWQDLKDLFRQAGTIVRADVALGPDGRSRGFGTVVYATEKDAHRAVGMFSGYEYNGRTLKVHYDKFSQGTQPLFNEFGLSPYELGVDMYSMPLPQLQPRLFDFHDAAPPPMQQSSSTAHTALAQLQSHFQQLQLETQSPIQSHAQSEPQPEQQQHGSRSPELPSSASSSSSSSSPRYASAAAASAKRTPTSPHPHHPGPIALPPPPALAPATDAYGNSTARAFNPPAYALTPLGLPPITPSMPPFSFLPMPSPSAHPHQQQQSYFGLGPATPTHAHFMNMTPLATPTSPHFPAYTLAAPVPGMSMPLGMGPPSALSPGAFWGRAGEGSMYAAPVGQPPHAHPASPYHFGGSPGFFGMHPMAPVEEPKGYFDFPPAPAPAPVAGALEKEIMRGEREKEERAAEGERVEPPEPPGVIAPSPPAEPEVRARRHSTDAPPSPMREGRRPPPPPLRLPSATGSD
ncbi:hypothetical protein B0H15DRAFT_26510 [Mycena belliarum]|uniref:RRM domain-containing protein n=1 Tax=Mycena belliarum TaxID=1033014 RepID=A0AAD6UNM9_9AGAR|nr:hypothetical protein B0H15DRAFT_26510 [Mycena belliae]